MRTALILGVVLLATPALADPCTAPVKGYRAGQTVSGPVRYIGDGDGLCVGPSSDPSTWVEIRLADFYAPELSEPTGEQAKHTLERLVQGRALSCRVGGKKGRATSYDRVLATCYLDGQSVGDLMRRVGVQEGGRGR